MNAQWNHKISDVNGDNFEEIALQVFRFQFENNQVYGDYTKALGRSQKSVKTLDDIPFLPIRFFRTHTVTTGTFQPEAIFESSGTTASTPGRHFVKDLALYEESFQTGFIQRYGPIAGQCVIGLLPSYLERRGSSLVYMVNKLQKLTGRIESDFYLSDLEKLAAVLNKLEMAGIKTILIGVSFALLDFAAHFPFPLRHTTVIETGGMKGRRREMVREELHAILKRSFQLDAIHSEYGMTELLSQAYSSGNGFFSCPPWMKMMIRSEDDPLQPKFLSEDSVENPVSGAFNIIDLANLYSCSFIATDDLGKLYSNGDFEIQGRMDNSDIRGCNLMIA